MEENSKSKFESMFQSRDDSFSELYDYENYDSHMKEPYPILESLRAHPTRYNSESFFCSGGEKRIFKVRDMRSDRTIALAKPLKTESEERRVHSTARFWAVALGRPTQQE